jgi:phosphate starvation-inducible PhoH-like protein
VYTPLTAKTDRQAEYIDAIRYYDQVVCLGPAGTGKTYIAANLAAEALLNGDVDQIILTRPNVGAGDSLGFFPGALEDKMAPWLAPLTTVLTERLGRERYQQLFGKAIKIVPLETIRGQSFNRSFVICDESQNLTLHQLKAFVTRQGEESKCIINGDIRQTDLGDDSGLKKLIEIIEDQRLRVPVVEFTVDDIVRSGICRDWVIAFMEAGV